MKKNVKNLVFLEFVDEAKIFLKKYHRAIEVRKEDFTVVCFHPKIKAFLQETGLDVIDSHVFFPTSSHRRAIQLLQDWTDLFRGKLRLKDKNGVKNSYVENLIFYLRGNLSTWVYRAGVMKEAISQIDPVCVICPGTKKVRFDQKCWVSPGERFLYQILDQIKIEKDIKKESLPTSTSFYCLQERMREWFYMYTKLIVSTMIRLFISKNNRLVVAPSDGHNMDLVFKDLRNIMPGDVDIAFIGIPGKGLKERIKRIKEAFNRSKVPFTYLFVNMDRKFVLEENFLKELDIFDSQFDAIIRDLEYEQIKPHAWLSSKYRKVWRERCLIRTYYQSRNLNQFILDHKICLVVAQQSRGISAVMGELCKKYNITSLMIPHGSFGPVKDKYSLMEWNENALGMVNTYYQLVSLQTPLIENYVKESPPMDSQQIRTGPLILGRISVQREKARTWRDKICSDQKKIILHASTPKNRFAQRFINYETIDEYVENLGDLIQVVDKIPSVFLIIRYREVDGLRADELKRLLPTSQNYMIATNKSFTDYLSIADLLVSYSSTTIEEALQNNIPVLLYNKFNRYCHIEGVHLTLNTDHLKNSAVFNVDREEDLNFGLKWVLDNQLNIKKDWEYLFKKYKYDRSKTVALNSLFSSICLDESEKMTEDLALK